MPSPIPGPNSPHNGSNIPQPKENEAFYWIGQKRYTVTVVTRLKNKDGSETTFKSPITKALAQQIEKSVRILMRNHIFNPKENQNLSLRFINTNGSDKMITRVIKYDKQHPKGITLLLQSRITKVLQSLGTLLGNALGIQRSTPGARVQSPVTPTTTQKTPVNIRKEPGNALGIQRSTPGARLQSPVTPTPTQKTPVSITNEQKTQMVWDLIKDPTLLDQPDYRELLVPDLCDFFYEQKGCPSQQIAQKLTPLLNAIEKAGKIEEKEQKALLALSKDCPHSKKVFASSSGDPLKALELAINDSYKKQNPGHKCPDDFGKEVLTPGQRPPELSEADTRYIMVALKTLITKANNESERISTALSNFLEKPSLSDNQKKIAGIFEDIFSSRINQSLQASAPAPVDSGNLTQAKKPGSTRLSQNQQILSDPPGPFKISSPSDGDCAAHSILNQLQQRNILKPNNMPFTNQQEVRSLASTHLNNIAKTLAAAEENTPESDIATHIITSVMEAYDKIEVQPASLQPILRNLKGIVNRYKTPEVKLSKPDKETLLKAYASCINTKGFWLDAGFFALVAKALNRQIVLLSGSFTNPSELEITAKFPIKEIQADKALFILFNGVASSGGNHYDSISTAHKATLTALINKDRQK